MLSSKCSQFFARRGLHLPTRHLLQSRALVWQGIVDAGHDHLDVPRRLEWDNTRNQREYLNARDDGRYYKDVAEVWKTAM